MPWAPALKRCSSGFHTPPPVTTAATSTPEFVAIRVPPPCLGLVLRKEFLEDAKTCEEGRRYEISIPISSMANPPCTREASQDLVIASVSTSMVSHPQSIGEASQAQTPSWYDHNVDQFKYVFKKTPKSDKERRAKTLALGSAHESRVLCRRGLILMIHQKFRII
ncbi:hypothetical protein SUGI_0034190 [Cryptomeria japonica]|nr:hypothetical protein SUGI_0034190 [Cryptomeria japonica]